MHHGVTAPAHISARLLVTVGDLVQEGQALAVLTGVTGDADTTTDTTSGPHPGIAEAAARQRDAQLRKPFEKKLAAIEQELAALGLEAKAAEAVLASSEAYEEAGRDKLQQLLERRGVVAERIAKLEEDWLWTQAQMDLAVKGPAPSP